MTSEAEKKELPILMSTWSVQRILAGAKTQTRRLRFKCAPGDHLWVRETWAPSYDCGHYNHLHRTSVLYQADGHTCPERWRPSIFMPKRIARIWLEVLDYRDEFLQDISEEDAIAEGIIMNPPHLGIAWNGEAIESRTIDWAPSRYFQELWDDLNGKKAPWSRNPEVKVITFRRIEP